jgi:hypothetical protein
MPLEKSINFSSPLADSSQLAQIFFEAINFRMFVVFDV